MVSAASLFDDGVRVFEDLVDCHSVHFAAVVVAGLDGVLKVATGCLGGKIVGDDVAGAALLFNPCEVRHGDPYGAAVDGKAYISGVGVAGGDGDDGALPFTVEVFAGPSVSYSEVFIHGWF